MLVRRRLEAGASTVFLNTADKRNSTYKDRFSSLQNLVLIMFEDDKVLIPKETAWFGYYPDGAFSPIQPPQQTKLYTEDWIGLKSLDDAGRVRFISVAGGHLKISKADMKKYVVPYLQEDLASENGNHVGVDRLNYRVIESRKTKGVNKVEDKASSELILDGSSSYSWPSSVKSFIGELLEGSEDVSVSRH